MELDGASPERARALARSVEWSVCRHCFRRIYLVPAGPAAPPGPQQPERAEGPWAHVPSRSLISDLFCRRHRGGAGTALAEPVATVAELARAADEVAHPPLDEGLVVRDGPLGGTPEAVGTAQEPSLDWFFDTEESALVVFVPPALTTAEGYCQGGQYRLAANEADFESPADEPSEP